MVLPKTSTAKRGFTLIETLIVLSLLAVIAAFALGMNLDAFSGSLFRGDQDTYITLVRQARAEAMHGSCASVCTSPQPWGVHIDASHFVLFQGNSFNANDEANEYFDHSSALQWSGASDILFAPFSGDATTASTTLSENGRARTVTVSDLGAIDWSN